VSFINRKELNCRRLAKKKRVTLGGEEEVLRASDIHSCLRRGWRIGSGVLGPVQKRTQEDDLKVRNEDDYWELICSRFKGRKHGDPVSLPTMSFIAQKRSVICKRLSQPIRVNGY